MTYLQRAANELKKRRFCWFVSNTIKYKLNIRCIKDFDIKSVIVENAAYRKIKRKYKYIFERKYNFSNQIASNKIWFCWLQGLENAPALVKKCYNNLINKYGGRVVLITNNNLKEYITIPEFITQALSDGIMSYQYYSDIVRLLLLIKHGGTWIDSTIYVGKKGIPDYMLSSDLFMFYHGDRCSKIEYLNFFMTSKSNNPVLMMVLDVMLEVYKKQRYPDHYLQISIATSIALEYFPEYKNKILKYSDVNVHLLQKKLNDKFDSKIYNFIMNDFPVQKLSNKIKFLDKNDTFYHKIIESEEFNDE